MIRSLQEQLDWDHAQAQGLEALGFSDLPFVNRPFLAVQAALRVYTARSSLLLLGELGLESRLRQGCTLEELLEGLPGQARFPLGWMLPFLADEGQLEVAEGRYTLRGTPELTLEDVRAFAEREAPGNLVGFKLLDAIRQRIHPFFTEGRNGESLLFDLSVFPVWLEYFGDENLTYHQNNLVTLHALREGLPPGARVLELGGGSGSFTTLFARDAAARETLGEIAEYRFTDLAPAFLRRAQRELGVRAPGLPLSFGILDINRPLAAQGLGDARYDAIVAVNVLHVAKDLVPALRELRTLLAPGGRLVLGECLKPELLRPIYTEFFFQFMSGYTQVNLDPVLRPVHGFLTGDAWEANLRAAGFSAVAHKPDTRVIQRQFPSFYVGALAASG
ncbi:MAG: class I SAM-dependent methyltransferase [Acidobacteria bacterium]|nr:class I SAM-dependent methyltransferase [Acidobacteriota bacterium]